MADKLPPLECRTSRKSGALTDPEPLGPVRACSGMTFTFTFIIRTVCIYVSKDVRSMVICEAKERPRVVKFGKYQDSEFFHG